MKDLVGLMPGIKIILRPLKRVCGLVDAQTVKMDGRTQ